MSNLSFRFTKDESAYRQELSTIAEQLSLSPNLTAKALVKEAIEARIAAETRSESSETDATLQQLRESLQAILRTQEKFRVDFRSAVNILLVKGGKLTPEQARTWVQDTLV